MGSKGYYKRYITTKRLWEIYLKQHIWGDHNSCGRLTIADKYEDICYTPWNQLIKDLVLSHEVQSVKPPRTRGINEAKIHNDTIEIRDGRMLAFCTCYKTGKHGLIPKE